MATRDQTPRLFIPRHLPNFVVDQRIERIVMKKGMTYRMSPEFDASISKISVVPFANFDVRGDYGSLYIRDLSTVVFEVPLAFAMHRYDHPNARAVEYIAALVYGLKRRNADGDRDPALDETLERLGINLDDLIERVKDPFPVAVRPVRQIRLDSGGVEISVSRFPQEEDVIVYVTKLIRREIR